MIFLMSSFLQKAPFLKFHAKTQSRCFQIPPVGRAFFENAVFVSEGLVWTVGLSVEIKLRFQVSLSFCGRGLRTRAGLQGLTCYIQKLKRHVIVPCDLHDLA